MKNTHLILTSLLILGMLSCSLDSYVRPGEPVAPQSEVQAVPLPEAGRTVPGNDIYFNSYSYIRVFDGGNRADILTFGPDKDKIGEFLRYSLLNTPDPGASPDGSAALLNIETWWGSYEILGSTDIDLYSLYDYSYEFGPTSTPFTDRLGVTVRRNTSPYKEQTSFSLNGDGTVLTFGGQSYLRMDQYLDAAIADAVAGGAGSGGADALELGRVLYLNVLLTQAVIPGWGGLYRYIDLVSNVISAIINDGALGDVTQTQYSSLYGEGLFRDTWIPPIEANPLPSNTKLFMYDSHQVLSHMVVQDAAGDQMLAGTKNDGSGTLWGGYDVVYTDQAGTQRNLSLFLGDNKVFQGSSLTLIDSVVSAGSSSGTNYPLAVIVDGTSYNDSPPADTDYRFFNPGYFTLPATE